MNVTMQYEYKRVTPNSVEKTQFVLKVKDNPRCVRNINNNKHKFKKLWTLPSLHSIVKIQTKPPLKQTCRFSSFTNTSKVPTLRNPNFNLTLTLSKVMTRSLSLLGPHYHPSLYSPPPFSSSLSPSYTYRVDDSHLLPFPEIPFIPK